MSGPVLTDSVDLVADSLNAVVNEAIEQVIPISLFSY
jgi:hypothetical protein